EWALSDDLHTLIRAGLGLVIARTAFWLLWFLTCGMGFGDVRLAALVGLVTARLGWTPFVVGIYAALVAAAAYGLARAVARRGVGRRRASVPLGPFLLLGAWLGLLSTGL
ncbi:MAG: prepilin peptidase, partial [Phycicoccus sp.]